MKYSLHRHGGGILGIAGPREDDCIQIIRPVPHTGSRRWQPTGRVGSLGGSSRCACSAHEHASKALQQTVSHTAAHKNDDPNFDAEETAAEAPNN